MLVLDPNEYIMIFLDMSCRIFVPGCKIRLQVRYLCVALSADLLFLAANNR